MPGSVASHSEAESGVEPAKSLRWGIVPTTARAKDAILIGTLAAAAFLIGALIWPLFPGRDAQTYLMYYLEMGRANPVFPVLMLFRTPGAPLFFGPPLSAGYPLVAEILLAVWFVVAIVSVYLIGCFWSRRIGFASAVVVLLYPAYNVLYHQVSSDGLFAGALPVWLLLLCAAVREPALWKFVLVGVSVFVLAMIRPAGAVFLVFAVFTALLSRAPLTSRLRYAGVAAATGGLLLIGWAGLNSIRYGDFTISRLAPINVPFFRLYMMDRLIRPENGPASRALADAVASDLLPREPYNSYGVSLDYFLKHGRRYMLSDLAPMSDRVWGWDSDYEILNRASREAIQRHPMTYAKGVVMATIKTLNEHSYPRVAKWPPRPLTIRCELACSGEGTIVRNGRVLPAPYYPDETIPYGHAYWLQSTPDSSISTDWSDLAQPRLVFKTADQERAYSALSSRLANATRNLPPREPVTSFTAVANLMAELLPSMWTWLLIGIAGIVWHVRFNRRLLLALPLMGVSFILINSLGLPGSQEYRLPFDPIFILFGVAGFAGVGAAISDRARGRATKPEEQPFAA